MSGTTSSGSSNSGVNYYVNNLAGTLSLRVGSSMFPSYASINKVTVGSFSGGFSPMSGVVQEVVVYNTDRIGDRTGIVNNVNEHYQVFSP